MGEYYNSGGIGRRPSRQARALAYAVLLAAAVVFILPFSQHLTSVGERRTIRSIDIALPPPPPPPPEPPPPKEEKVETPPPELKQQPKPLSLSQLQLALNPGTGDAMGAAFGMGSFEVETDALGDLNTFSVAELDERPTPMRAPPFRWPQSAYGQVREDVNLKALVVINEKGGVEFQRFLGISDDTYSDDFIAYLQSMRFSRPMRQGKAVRARYSIPLTLAKPQ